MCTRKYSFVFILIITLFFVTASSALATSFSISAGGVTPAPPDDILAPPVPSPILTGVGVEVDAFSFGHLSVGLEDISALEFSVDSSSVGLGGTAVDTEATIFEAHADIFTSSLGGSNSLLFDGDGSSDPTLGLTELVAPTTDNVDGYDKNPGPSLGPIWFLWDLSVFKATILTTPAGAGYSGAGMFFATPATLGLVDDDDIDALVVLEDGVGLGGAMSAGDCILFSLAPGSPSLLTIPASPADILNAGSGCPGPVIFATEASLGLAAGDNVDALAIPFTPTAVSLQAISSQPDYGYTLIMMTGIILLALVSIIFIRRTSRFAALAS